MWNKKTNVALLNLTKAIESNTKVMKALVEQVYSQELAVAFNTQSMFLTKNAVTRLLATVEKELVHKRKLEVTDGRKQDKYEVKKHAGKKQRARAYAKWYHANVVKPKLAAAKAAKKAVVESTQEKLNLDKTLISLVQ